MKRNKKKFQAALDKFREALTEMKEAVGEDSFNFVGSTYIFDDDMNCTDDSMWWYIGDDNTCIVNAECLVEEIKKEIID